MQIYSKLSIINTQALLICVQVADLHQKVDLQREVLGIIGAVFTGWMPFLLQKQINQKVR